jgi:hypothetical protein
MSYTFRNPAFVAYMTARGRAELPSYCERAAFVLSEEVRGYNFQETGSDGHVHVAMFEHSFEEICSFVDWSAEIWNATMRQEVHRSRRLKTEELIANHRLRDGDLALESLLLLFEGWHEDSSLDDGPYVSKEKYPLASLRSEPFATVGNLCAAVGLAVLDNLTSRSSSAKMEDSLYELGLAWEFALLARWNNHMDMAMHFEAESSRQKMIRAARAKHSKDPKQQVKLQVRELWQQWEKTPGNYRSIAAFARDMCEKWPDHITSEVVVSRWVRDWRRSSSE